MISPSLKQVSLVVNGRSWASPVKKSMGKPPIPHVAYESLAATLFCPQDVSENF